MRRPLFLLVLLAGCGRAPLADAIDGWRATASAQRFDRRGLYSHIDGAAEVYLMYGFSSLRTRAYARGRGPVLTVEIFDMGGTDGAFGAFAHARDLDGQRLQIGEEAQLLGGLLMFWKGRHLVLVGANERGAPDRELEQLARAVATTLPAGAGRPAIVGLLPGGGQRERTIRYVRSRSALAYHYSAAGDLSLGLDDGAVAVLADYRRPAGDSVLILVRYPDGGQASRALRAIDDRYLAPASAPTVRAGSIVLRPRRAAEGGRWGAAATVGPFLIAVLEAPSAAEGRALVDETRQRVQCRASSAGDPAPAAARVQCRASSAGSPTPAAARDGGVR